MLAFLISVFAKAFGTTYSDWGNVALAAQGGSFLAAGGAGTFSGDAAAVLLDAQGNLLWARVWGTSDYEEIWGAAQLASGDFVLVGGLGIDEEDLIAAIVDASGNLKGSWVLDGGSNENAWGVCSAPDGGFVVVGETKSFSQDPLHYDALIMKVGPDGQVQWAKVLGVDTTDDYFFDVIYTGDGYLAVGEIGINYGDGLLAKFDESGNLLWAKALGGSYYDAFYGVSEASGGFALAGPSDSYGGFGSGWLVKVDGAGSVQWAVSFSDNQWLTFPKGRSLAYSGGSYYVSARSGIQLGQVALLKFSEGGNLEWAKTFGNAADDWAGGLAPSPDGGVFATGESWGFGLGNGDLIALQLGPTGDYPNCYFYSYSPDITNPTPTSTDLPWLSARDANASLLPLSLSSGGSLAETEICPSGLHQGRGLARLRGYGVKGGIVFQATRPAEVEIYAPSGRLAARVRLREGRTFVPLSPGVYLWPGGKALVK